MCYITIFYCQECTDIPTQEDISEGDTCQTYIDLGRDMADYCNRPEWIEDKICGQTCAFYGFTTDPSCHAVASKKNKRYSLVILCFYFP